MNLSLYDAQIEGLKNFKPAAAPNINLLLTPGSPEETDELRIFLLKEFVSTLESALIFLGYKPNSIDGSNGEVDIYCGTRRPLVVARCWLKPALPPPAGRLDGSLFREIQGKGYSSEVLSFLALKTHYRRGIPFSWPALEQAREELAVLKNTAQTLQRKHAGSAPNSQGLAGYKKRFRDALANDLDFPGALAAIWDALRPGALSPGSQLGYLGEVAACLRLKCLVPGR